MRVLYVVRLTPLLLCLGCSMLTHSVPSPAALPRDVAAAVASVREDSITVAGLEQRVETAAAQRDAEFLDRVWAPTFRFVHAGGTVQTRAELLHGFTQPRRANAARTLGREVDSLGVEMHGNTAITTGLIHARQCTGAIYREYTVRFIRVYGRRDSSWQLLSHHSIGMMQPASTPNVGVPPSNDRCS